MSDGKGSPTSWLVPALVGAGVALISTGITYSLTSWKETREQMRGVAAIRSQIITSATGNSVNRVAARLTLDYVLKPIDESGQFEEFSRRIDETLSDHGPGTPPGAERESLAQIAPPISGDISDLISKFTGPERLAASNALVDRAKDNPNAVVDALVGSLRPQEAEFSYRFNLYVVFTLARIPNKWPGTEAQRDAVIALKDSSNYTNDETFRSRTAEAISNWRKR